MKEELKDSQGNFAYHLLHKWFQTAQNPSVLQIPTLYHRTSNGYLEYIFRRMSSEIFKKHIPQTAPLNYKVGKNRHYQEVSFENLPIKMISAYGF